jgi:hypothetical protein
VGGHECHPREVPVPPDFIPATANKRLASRFYQLKTGYCLVGASSGRRAGPAPSAGGARTRPRRGSIFSRIARNGSASRGSCGRRWRETGSSFFSFVISFVTSLVYSITFGIDCLGGG